MHYFSPEQARGGFSDEKSDLYSLGIVLYELVTGKLPFNGESPVAIALKHIQDIPEEPLSIKEDLPQGINDIIMVAIEKDQKNRYQSATEMLEHLYKVLKKPEMEIILGDGGNVYDSPTVRMPSIGDKKILGEKDSQKTGDNKMKKKKDKDKATIILAIATSVIVISLIVFLIAYIIWPNLAPPDEYIVKDYAGLNYYQVKAELENNKIIVEEDRKNDESIKKDLIITQDKPEGTELKMGGYSKVILTVSDGPVYVKIDDYANVDYRTVEKNIEALGLDPKVIEEYSEDVPVGLVTRTEPGEGQELRLGKIVRIYKSMGPEIIMTIVPDLSGKTKMEALNLLAEKNLAIGVIYPEDKTNTVDKVVKQEPKAGETIVEGEPVDIYLEEIELNENNEIIRARPLVLSDEDSFGEFISVLVNITRSNTNVEEQLYSEVKRKTDFPLTLSIPIPKDGTTKVRVFLNSEFYSGFTEKY